MRRRAALGAAVVAALALLWWLLRGPSSPDLAPAASPELPTVVEEVAPSEAAAAPDELVEVECELVEDPGGWRLELRELDPDTLAPTRTHDLYADGRYVTFRAAPDGLGVLSSQRHRPRPLAWVDGVCTRPVELEALPFRTVRGRLDGPIDVGAVAVHGRCDGAAPGGFSNSVGRDGAFELQIPDDASCALVVSRVFGGRDLASEPVGVAGSTGDVDDVLLVVPRPPGHGMGLFPSEGGLRVYDVDPGSAADEAGLERQDLVVAIDGEPADELDLDLVLEDTTPMTLEVLRGDEVLELRLQ